MNFSFAEPLEEPETTDANRDRSIICGDCLEVMPTLEANSIDSIVTDPPYGLSLMGKDWDSGVPGVAFWKEALRVAKPGAHLLAFGGTRTFHRLVVAIEDAGWEIRDMIEWVYGSGFPKSLNISKAIDKEAGAEREVVEQKNYGGRNRFSVTAGASNGGVQGGYNFGDNRSITAPATPDAVVWDGWGTGLKPSHESIIVARKPIEKGLTIAQNCLKWGTGGINVDGCRVTLPDGDSTERPATKYADKSPVAGMNASKIRGSVTDDWKKGRFPANLIHDGSEEVLACFPNSKSISCGPCIRGPQGTIFKFTKEYTTNGFNDSGSAARFFKSFPQEPLCALCNLTSIDKHGIINEKEEPCLKDVNIVEMSLNQKIGTTINASVVSVVQHLEQPKKEAKEPLKLPVRTVENLSEPLQVKKENGVPKNVENNLLSNLTLCVKSAGNLCDLCGTAIAQSIVQLQQGQDPESILGLVSINGHKKQILTRCLVSFVELLGNTDTTPTTENLNLLFGYVYHAIENSTEEIKDLMEKETCLHPRLVYQSKASKSDRDEGLENMESKSSGVGALRDNGRESLPRHNNHPTVKPTKLMAYLCRLITPPEGLVLDPFAGSGSTGKACKQEGFRFIGIEKDEEYCKIARARIE